MTQHATSTRRPGAGWASRLIIFFSNLIGWFGVIWRRVRSHATLLLAVWAGCTLAVALVVSIPIYAEAAGYRILLAELSKAAQEDPLPPFSIIYTFGGSGSKPITWAKYQEVNAFAGDVAQAGIDLPVEQNVRYGATDQLRFFYPGIDNKEVGLARFGFLTGMQEHIQLMAGDMPQPYSGTGPMDVLVSETSANKLTLLEDDIYNLRSANRAQPPLDIPIRVAGIWRAADPDSAYWFFPPTTFSGVILAPEESFARVLGMPNAAWVRYANWYSALDVQAVRSAEVSRLTGRIKAAAITLDRTLPGAKISRSPVEAMEHHRDQVRLLTVTLALFSVPLLGLIGYFLIHVAGMVVQRQQQEIAIMRSRGSSRSEVLGLALGQGLVLGAAALLVGVPLGLFAAQLIAWTQSFLRWSPQPGPAVRLLAASWWHGLLVVLLAVPAILLPALSASKRTIISYKQERARATHVPLWQRLGIDLLLLIPAIYGYQQLRLHGVIGVPGIAGAADDPFRNPVLMLAPALLVFALALVALRLLPRVLRLLARLFAHTSGVSALLALRFLARTTQTYSGPILLIALTMSLAGFTASMARTLDAHSADRALYRSGADVRLIYAPAKTAAATGSASEGSGDAFAASSAAYLSVPVDDYLMFPGVRAVTRVAPSAVYITPGGGVEEEGTFLAVDRSTFAAVVGPSWRSDYAGESLGELMNRLAIDPSAVLVSSDYAGKQGLKVGDRLAVGLNDLGETREVPLVVVGIVDYFPTLFKEDGPFVIGNLDYSVEQQGAAYPFQIWVDMAPGADTAPVTAQGFGFGLVRAPETPESLLNADLLRPERQGLFGVLSVGFMAAVLVTILGFLAHTLRSFQRRLVELGMLRAIGLGTGQLMSMLIYEQAAVLGVGAAVGTGLGVLVSRLFVPFLQVRAVDYPDTPPFVVQIAWSEIAIVCAVAVALLVCVVAFTLVFLRRMRLFEVVKLGEAV